MPTIIHHNDNDGRLGAWIAKNSLSANFSIDQIKFLEMDYKDLENFEPEKIGSEDIYIIDFSVTPAHMQVFINRGCRVTWFDHHKTVLDKYNPEMLKDIRGVRDINKSGCMLAWEHFMGDNIVPEVVKLIDDYDCWKLQMADSKHLNYATQAYDTSPQGDFWLRCNSHIHLGVWEETFLRELIESGKVILNFVHQRGEELYNSFGYQASIGDYKCSVFNNPNPGMDWFWLFRDNCPINIRTVFDGVMWTVSLYSETIDVGEIAKAHGGGGHKGAAGFTCIELPFKKDES